MINNLGEENIFRWHFHRDNNYKQFIDVELSLKLSLLPINESIFHYKTNGCMHNFIKNSQTEVFERNVRTNETRTLNVDFKDYNIISNSHNHNYKNWNSNVNHTNNKHNHYYMSSSTNKHYSGHR